MPRSPRYIPAFTLIEVLVAMIIIGMITAGLAVSLSTAFKARRSAVDGLATIRSARLGLDAIGHDFQSALPPTGVFAGAFTGTDAASTLGSSGDGDTVTFSNTSDPTRTTDGASDVQQITLSLVADSDITPPTNTAVGPNQSTPQAAVTPPTNLAGPRIVAGNTSGDGMLVRTVTRQLLAPVAPDPEQQVICRHVSSFNVRYFDGTQWLDTWDSTANNNVLPVAVEVTLQITPTQSASTSSAPAQPQKFVRIYPLACADLGAIGTTSGGTASTP